MIKSLLGSNSLQRVNSEHFLEEIEGRSRDFLIHGVGKVEIAGSIFIKDFIIGFLGEDTVPEEENVKYDSNAENITYRGVLFFHVPDIDNFGSHITRGPTTHK